jgi:hypothetical protein
MRGAPQSGLAKLMSRISRRISGRTCGRPPCPLDLRRQNDRNPARCQPITVSGRTMARASIVPGTGRYSPTNTRRSKWPKANRRAYLAGNELALPDAWAICAKHDLPVPTWVVVSAPAFLSRAIKGKLRRHKGPGGNPISWAKGIAIEYAHWSAVEEVRERQKDPDWHEYLAMLSDPNLTLAERKQLHDQRPRDPGRTLEDAFRVASELLLGTPA